MERLTRLCADTESGKFCRHTAGSFIGIYPDCTLGKVVEKLAEYEDLEEQGLLIKLPCELGTPLYYISEPPGITPFIVSGIKFRLDDLKRFGRDFFLTKEDAEAALKQRSVLR